MKRVAKLGAVFLWLVFATLALVYWWARHPQAIPSPPEGFWIWLTDVADAHGCESVADVEFLYMLTVSFLFANLCTFVAWRILKRLRKS